MAKTCKSSDESGDIGRYHANLDFLPSDLNVKVAEFLWPYMSAVVPRLLDHPVTCAESFELIRVLICKLFAKSSPVLDLPQFAVQCADLLLQLNSTEVRSFHLGRRYSVDMLIPHSFLRTSRTLIRMTMWSGGSSRF